MNILPVPAQSSSSTLTYAAAVQVIESADVGELTRSQYKRDVRNFTDWLGNRSLYPNIIRDYKRALQQRTDIGTGSKKKYLAVAKTLCRELYRLQVIPIDVTAGVKGFKTTRSHKRPRVSDAEQKLVYQFLNNPDEDPENKAIISLLLMQGLRRTEVAQLEIDDLDLETKTLKILGKAREDKEVIDIHPFCMSLITTYLDHAGLRSGFMFPSVKKPNTHISSNGLWRRVMRINERIGVKDKCVHSYRHSFCTRLIQNGGLNMAEVITFTRHRSLETLQVYYHRMKKEDSLPKFYAAFSPES